uniref:GNAT family N-acetyltransferase n=1 Tax=Gemmiger formicilis TaxID=745368 RepID=UPI003FF0267F
MDHLGTVPLQTQQLSLRRLTFDDCRTMFDHWAGDPQVTRYLRWNAHRDWTVTAEYLYEMEKCYADSTVYNWGICLQDGTLIGTIGVGPAERAAAEGWQTLPEPLRHTEIWEPGYALGRAWWGRGYATEALQKVLEFWFNQVHGPWLFICHAHENPASRRVIEKTGFLYDHDAVYHKYDGTPVPCRAYYKINPIKEM